MKIVASLVSLLVSALLVPVSGSAPALSTPTAGVAPVRAATTSAPRRAPARVLESGNGHLVVAFGDPAHARHIAVVVPGVGVTPATFDDPEHPWRRPFGMALALRERAPDTAVIAWLGYRPPAGLGWDAATGQRAREGADALRAFVARLRGSALPGAAIGVICHSYGTTVCGVAAGGTGLPVDDLVLLAAPGVRAESAAALGAHVRVWAARARGDWIRWVPHVRIGDLGHGADPADPAFGALPLPVGGVHGHDGYFAPGSSTLDALAVIVSGGVRTAVLASRARRS